jgi:hypothetical protein
MQRRMMLAIQTFQFPVSSCPAGPKDLTVGWEKFSVGNWRFL